MAPRFSWIAFGVLLVFLYCGNSFGKKLHLVKKKAETVTPSRKSIVGNFDLKKSSKSVHPKDCKNFKPKAQCHKMMAIREHACLLNQKYMWDNCKLACRFCSPFDEAHRNQIGRRCRDLNPQCGRWAKRGDCLHYVAYMMDVCRKSCEICGNDEPNLRDTDERCPKWGKTGFCEIKVKKMQKICPYSCRKYANRHYTVKYAKPPKRRSPRPTHAPKPTKPTPRPTKPLTEQEKEDLKEALEEYAEEEENRRMEKEEQRQQKDEGKVTPLQAPPVLDKAKTHDPLPIPAPILSPVSLEDLNIDVPSEYEGAGAKPQAE